MVSVRCSHVCTDLGGVVPVTPHKSIWQVLIITCTFHIGISWFLTSSLHWNLKTVCIIPKVFHQGDENRLAYVSLDLWCDFLAQSMKNHIVLLFYAPSHYMFIWTITPVHLALLSSKFFLLHEYLFISHFPNTTAPFIKTSLLGIILCI